MARDERRERLLEELRGARGGLDVRELAERLDAHQNTVRWHLGGLADAGLVASRPAARSEPGRPRILYSLSAAGRRRGRDEHRLLAAVLADTVAREPDGAARAREAGCAWGRSLVHRPAARRDDGTATARVVALLDEQGFEPECLPGELRMRRCPFHELAETQPRVVCAVHRGLIDGALRELGSDLEVESLDVFVEPDLCVARLAAARG